MSSRSAVTDGFHSGHLRCDGRHDEEQGRRPGRLAAAPRPPRCKHCLCLTDVLAMGSAPWSSSRRASSIPPCCAHNVRAVQPACGAVVTPQVTERRAGCKAIATRDQASLQRPERAARTFVLASTSAPLSSNSRAIDKRSCLTATRSAVWPYCACLPRPRTPSDRNQPDPTLRQPRLGATRRHSCRHAPRVSRPPPACEAGV